MKKIIRTTSHPGIRNLHFHLGLRRSDWKLRKAELFFLKQKWLEKYRSKTQFVEPKGSWLFFFFSRKSAIGHIPTNIVLVHAVPSCLVKIYFIFVFPFTPLSSKMSFPYFSSDSVVVCMSCKMNKNLTFLCKAVCRFLYVLTSEILFSVNIFGS